MRIRPRGRWVRWFHTAVYGLCLAVVSVQATASERVVSLSPNVTEILHGLGVFDRVVAVSTYCEYPEQAKALPRVGGWTNTNLEQLLSLRPDVVITTDAQAPLVGPDLDSLSVEWFDVPGQSLDDVRIAIRRIATRLRVPEAGERLVSDVFDRVDNLRELTRNVSRPRVLVVVDRLPGTLRGMYIATEGSFLTDLVRAAGGEPITPKAPHHYVEISTEALVAFDPEVILDVVQATSESVTLSNATAGLSEDAKEVWNDLDSVTAIRNGRVYLVDDRRAVHPSQFVADTGETFLRLIHPSLMLDEPKAPER